MKKTTFLIILLLSIATLVNAQDKRIESIRKIYKETNQQVADAEKSFKESEVFLTTMSVNKGETSYPAVGIYNKEIKFYYTYSNREKSQYPDHLLKVAVKTKRSAMVTNSEFYFDRAGNLVFYYEALEGEDAMRMYFDNGKVFRLMAGKINITNTNMRRKNQVIKEVLERKDKLLRIFFNFQE